MDEALTPLLLIVTLALACAWIGYRAEREQNAQRIRSMMAEPTDSAAFISALNAISQRINESLKRMELASIRAARRTPEPLPGTQQRRETKPDTRRRERKG